MTNASAAKSTHGFPGWKAGISPEKRRKASTPTDPIHQDMFPWSWGALQESGLHILPPILHRTHLSRSFKPSRIYQRSKYPTFPTMICTNLSWMKHIHCDHLALLRQRTWYKISNWKRKVSYLIFDIRPG